MLFQQQSQKYNFPSQFFVTAALDLSTVTFFCFNSPPLLLFLLVTLLPLLFIHYFCPITFCSISLNFNLHMYIERGKFFEVYSTEVRLQRLVFNGLFPSFKALHSRRVYQTEVSRSNLRIPQISGLFTSVIIVIPHYKAT